MIFIHWCIKNTIVSYPNHRHFLESNIPNFFCGDKTSVFSPLFRPPSAAPYAVAAGASSSTQPSQKILTQQVQSSVAQNIPSTMQSSRIEGGQFPSKLI